MSTDTRLRIIGMWQRNVTQRAIRSILAEEGIHVSLVSTCRLIRKFRETKSVLDHRTNKSPKILTEEQHRFIDNAMANNNELTGTQLRDKLKEQYPSLEVSISTVKRTRRNLGWVSKRTRYCALISETNREKRKKWSEERIAQNDLELKDVIWTDECTVQLEPHRKSLFHKKGEPSRLSGHRSTLQRSTSGEASRLRDLHPSLFLQASW